MKILLAEDEVKFGTSVKKQLEQDGYTVDWVQDGLAAKHAVLDFQYDVVIMDINLPKQDGISVIKELRGSGCHTPILILTANSRISDCVEGLDSGADDYLMKPFHYEEINSRLHALVRRERRVFDTVLTHRKLALDTKKRRLTFRGKPCDVTKLEYKLLEILLSDPTKTFSRQQLLDTIYGFDEFIESNVLNVHIHSLRKKFGHDYIKTVRGLGFKMGS